MATSVTPPATPIGAVMRHVKTHYGMMVNLDQMRRFEREVGRVCDAFGIASVGELLHQLEAANDNRLGLAVAEAASVNHTHFFREPGVLAYLDGRVLVRASVQRPLHIWSAAASSGEEAYTVAMMARERHLATGTIRILGTDISSRVIQRAQAGCYHARHLTHVPKSLRGKYFAAHSGGLLRAKTCIRELCMFRRFNLLGEVWPFKNRFHAVLLRNVLYYFSDRDQAELLRRIHHQVEPGGVLLVSVTESIGHLHTPWVATEPGVYLKRGT